MNKIIDVLHGDGTTSTLSCPSTSFGGGGGAPSYSAEVEDLLDETTDAGIRGAIGADVAPLSYLNGELLLLTAIGSLAFYGQTSGDVVSLGSAVTSIGSSAFGYNSASTFVIGRNVTSFGDFALNPGASLTTLHCYAPTAPTLGINVFPLGLTEIHVPVGATGYGTTYGGLTVVADL